MHRVGFHFEKHIHKQIDRQTDKNRQEGKSQEHTYQNIQCLLCGRNFNCIFFQSVLSFNSLQWQWITCIRKYWKRQMVTYGLHWWCQKILTPPSDKKSNSEILLFYKNTCTLYQLLFQPSSPISYTLNCIWSNLTITKRAIKSHQLLCFHRNGNSHLLNTPNALLGQLGGEDGRLHSSHPCWDRGVVGISSNCKWKSAEMERDWQIRQGCLIWTRETTEGQSLWRVEAGQAWEQAFQAEWRTDAEVQWAQSMGCSGDSGKRPRGMWPVVQSTDSRPRGLSVNLNSAMNEPWDPGPGLDLHVPRFLLLYNGG